MKKSYLKTLLIVIFTLLLVGCFDSEVAETEKVSKVKRADTYDNQVIPGKVEAESFTDKNGKIKIEPCDEGGEGLGYIEDGDWVKYKVNVETTGKYKVEYRVASKISGGRISLVTEA